MNSRKNLLPALRSSINSVGPAGLLLLVFLLYPCAALRAAADFSDIYLSHDRYFYLVEERERTSLNYHSFSTDRAGFDMNGNLQGRRTYYPVSGNGHTGLLYAPVETFITFNSAIAKGDNDGALWQGRGLNSVVRGGIEYSCSWASVRFAPEIWGAQNRDFDIIDTEYSSGYGDYWTPFDRLQRYGEDPVYDFSFGKSDIRFYFLRHFTAGVSTETVTLGPGKITGIILSNNAEGFPHIDFGTSGAVPLFSLGTVEIRAMFGILRESDYFDNDSSNDFGWISGLSAAWAPVFIRNFSFGFNYYYDKPMSGWDERDLIRFIPYLDASNPPGDQKDMMVSITFEWIFPSAGFTVYGEWARNDNFGDLSDLFAEPEHAQALTLGFSQRLNTLRDGAHLVLSGEFSNLGQERTLERRPAGPWYRHAWAGWSQGHTNRGQVLGAGTGPGSNSQWLELARVDNRGMQAFRLQRISHDRDYFYKLFSESGEYGNLECGVAEYTELYVAFASLLTAGRWDIFYEVGYSLLVNYNFEQGNTGHNIHLECGARYNY